MNMNASFCTFVVGFFRTFQFQLLLLLKHVTSDTVHTVQSLTTVVISCCSGDCSCEMILAI